VIIDPEFRALIAPLKHEERMQLEANLIAHGCRDPLVVWRGTLIDGHNRYEICQRKMIRFRTVEMALPSREHVLLWIEENQLGRRNLTDDQRAPIAESVSERRAELEKKVRAQKGRARGGKATPEQKKERDRLGDTVTPKRYDRSKKSAVATAKQYKISERKLRDIRAIKKTPKGAAAVAAIRSGEKTIKQVKRDIRVAEKQERVIAAKTIAETVPIPERCQLLHGDLTEVALEDGSIDVIITDPPYPKEFLPVFTKLAGVAARCLKPGGSLLVMCGQSYLPDVLRLLASDVLRYQWTLAYLTPGGQAAQVWPRKVNAFWKPVCWFVKGEYKGDWIGDVVTSAVNDNDKRFHNWGQSESGMAVLVERFSLPGQLILDPFVGGGTTGVVALKLGRRFIGIDSDLNSIAMTRARIAS
jgi:site-specific DNA-methyltransferase (adenine-specific)